MTGNSGNGAGRPDDPRRQAPPASGAKKSGAGAESQRGGETVPAVGPQTPLPEQFGPYRVKRKLGGGGMGTVYLVENTQLQREEALKVPHFEAGDEEVRKRFMQEAQAAARLESQPNLCPVYHVGEQDGICFLTMRYLEGKALSEYTGKPQPPRRSVEIVAKLAQALAYAHGKNIIHRDLKPSNVIMCAGVGPVVMDFGLAKQIRQQDQKLTQAGTIMGTPAYMPPEQVKGDLQHMGPASDVYSLGVILFELLTGDVPFRGATAEVFGKILYTEAPPPSLLVPGLSLALDAVCKKALAKAPEDRYPSMKAFAVALLDYLRATPPAEGGGNLVVTKPGKAADVFQAATVAPGKPPSVAPPSRVKPVPVATVVGGKRPSSVRKPAGAPQATVVSGPDEQEGGRSWGCVLGVALCLGLLLLAAGAAGVGALVYVLNQKKPEVSPVALVTPAVATSKAEESKPPETKPPETKPPESKPPETKPPETKPPETKPPPPKLDDPDPSVVLREEFKGVDVGGRPKGWEGDAFAVQKEESRPCLEVINPKGFHYVTLPRLAIKGDFVLEAEFRLGYEQHLHLELSSVSSTPLTVLVNDQGSAQIDATQMKETDGFRRYGNIRFRLQRKGDVYTVSINDHDTVGVTIPDKGKLWEVRIGLPGGIAHPNMLARLYSVKITSLEKDAGKPAGAEPLPGVREDFRKATLGSLPDGWTASALGNVAVQNVGDQRGLELANLARGTDTVTLPRVVLKGNFYADVTAVFPDQDEAVSVFFKGPNTTTLAVMVDNQGTVLVKDLDVKWDASKVWRRGGTNVLRVERFGKDGGYVVKVNDTQVGVVPAAFATGPFEGVDLMLGIKDQRKSPQVTSVVVRPLEAAADAKP